MKAVRVHQVGGPEVLQYEEVPALTPGPGQLHIKLDAVGLNFLDCYFRSGLYKASLPFTPGSEAAGIVSAVGPDVKTLHIGDRVAYAPVMGRSWSVWPMSIPLFSPSRSRHRPSALAERVILLAAMSNALAKGVYFWTLAREVRWETAWRYGLWAALHLPLAFLG